MRVAITGANGFIGKNLALRLQEVGVSDIARITRETTEADLATALTGADIVFHLAGVNRPTDPADFSTGNTDFTRHVCEILRKREKAPIVAYASSTQAELDNPYGASKRAAEDVLRAYATASGADVRIFRLTNVFGKWARPNYNSAVATFCHNIARGQAITVNDPSAKLRLVYVDDVASAFIAIAKGAPRPDGVFAEAGPVYETTVGEVADALRDFAESRKSLVTPRVGTGLLRALHATYLSYLPTEAFTYGVPIHADPRGEFVEMLKTNDSGQFSYFTAHPGITRGQHYHHSKTEKFLVLRGTAHFGFRHVDTGATHEIVVMGGEGRIVETVPGWTHNITNAGDDELVVMLWANEIFDRDAPDTIAMKV